MLYAAVSVLALILNLILNWDIFKKVRLGASTGDKTDRVFTHYKSNIDNGMDYLPFALVVCDANNLKK